MPSPTASLGPWIVTSSPSKLIVPASGGWMPAIVLTSVDLPAPLSPTSATTSPDWTSKSTSLSACTGPKLLLTPLRESTGALPFAFMSFSLLSVGRQRGARRAQPAACPTAGGARWRPRHSSPQDLLDASLLAG